MEIQSYVDVLLLTGSVLAVLMTFFLWTNPLKLQSNIVLGCITFSWGFTVFIFVVQSKEFYISYPHLFGISSVLCILFFPFLYIYVKSYMYGSVSKKEIVLHMLPVIIFCLLIAPFYLQKSDTKIEHFQNGLPYFASIVLKINVIIIIVQGILYSSLSIRLLHQFQFERKLNDSQNAVVLRIKQFVIVNILLWAIGASGVLLEEIGLETKYLDFFYIYYFGLTLLILSLGYFALKKPSLLRGMEFFNSQSVMNKVVTVASDKETVVNYLESEKPYLKRDLTLQDLSNGCGIPKYRVSEVFNSILGKSFSEVINEYRVNEAILMIQDSKHQRYTLTHIAEKAGFNSRASFYRIFKNITDKTPSEYEQIAPS